MFRQPGDPGSSFSRGNSLRAGVSPAVQSSLSGQSPLGGKPAAPAVSSGASPSRRDKLQSAVSWGSTEPARKPLITTDAAPSDPGNSGQRGEPAPSSFDFKLSPVKPSGALPSTISPPVSPKPVRPAPVPSEVAAAVSDPKDVKPASRSPTSDGSVSPQASGPSLRVRRALRTTLYATGTGQAAALEPLSRLKQAMSVVSKDPRGLDVNQFLRAVRPLVLPPKASARETRLVEEDLQDVFDEIDVDGSRRVTPTEVFHFLAYDEPELRALSRKILKCFAPLGDDNAKRQAALAAFRSIGVSLDSSGLKTALAKLGVTATVTEVEALFTLIDCDHSGFVTVDELKEWADITLSSSLAPKAVDAASSSQYSDTLFVVDLALSASAEEAAQLSASGYVRQEPSLNHGSLGFPVYLWVVKTSEALVASSRPPKEAKVSVETMRDSRVLDVVVGTKSVDAHLVADGFQRLPYSANAGNWFAGSVFIWLRRSAALPSDPFPIQDICVVIGDGYPTRGFHAVAGNLNAGSIGKSVHLWYLKSSYTVDYASHRVIRPAPQLKRDMENRLRERLRDHAKKLVAISEVSEAATSPAASSRSLTSPSGGTKVSLALSFELVFRRLVRSGKPGPPPDGTVVINLIRSQFREALHTELGMFIPREYERHLWERLDWNHDGVVSYREFEDFVSLDVSEIASKVTDVLDMTIKSLDEGMRLEQLFTPVIPPASRFSGPAPGASTSEEHFFAALERMRVSLSGKERNLMLTAFGFGEDRQLSLDLLKTMIDEHRARRDRVSRAVIRLREYLTVAATGKTVTRRSIKDVAKSAIHFEAAWDALCPIRDGRVAIVTLSALEKCLFGPVGLSPTDLRPTEVPQVLQVMVKGGPQKKDTAPSRSGVTFLEFCSFLSHDELIADVAVDRLLDLIRSSKDDPMAFFNKLDTDKSGTVAATELRRALNDAVSIVNATIPSSPTADTANLDYFSTEDVCGLIRRFDRDGDGNLNFPEFCTFIKLHALPATSGDGVRSSPVEPTVQTAKPRVVRGVTVSSTKAQEAACARKGFEAVRVDGLAEVLLWLDVDTSNPTPLPVDAIVSICVLPSDASRAGQLSLSSANYHCSAQLPGGSSLWCLALGDAVPAVNQAITNVQLTSASVGKGDPPTPTVGPGSGNGWRLAGTFSSATVSSSVWYSGGIDNEAWKRVQAAGTASLTIADKPAAADSPFVEVAVVQGRQLGGVSSCPVCNVVVSVCTPGAGPLDSRALSVEVSTLFTAPNGSNVEWQSLPPSEDPSSFATRPKLTLPIDVSKVKRPARPDDSTFELQFAVKGGSSSIGPVSTLSTGNLPLIWYERHPGVPKLEWVDVIDSRGLRSGQLCLWTCYHIDRSTAAIRGATVVDPASLLTVERPVVPASKPEPAAPEPKKVHVVEDDDDITPIVKKPARNLGVLTVTFCEASCGSGIPSNTTLTGQVRITASGSVVAEARRTAPSVAHGSVHKWSSDPTSVTVPIEPAWISNGRIVIDLFADVRKGHQPADDWSDDESDWSPGIVGSVKFALNTVTQTGSQRFKDRYILKAPQGGPATRRKDVEVLLQVEYKKSSVTGQAFDAVITDIQSVMRSRPGSVDALSAELLQSAVNGKATARSLDAALKSIAVPVSVSQLKQLVKGLLQEANAIGLDDDPSLPSELDVKVHGDTLFDVSVLMDRLRPPSALIPSTTAARQTAYPTPAPDVLKSVPVQPPVPPATPSVDATVMKIVSAIRTASAGDLTFAGPKAALSARDRDGTGYVSLDDVATVLKQYGAILTLQELEAALSRLNVHVDHFQKLNYQSFLTQVASNLPSEISAAEAALRKRMRESAWFGDNYLDFRVPFEAADVMGHGRLSLHEFQDAIGRLGVPMSQQELTAIARRIDVDGDGTLNYYEFSKLIDLDPWEIATIGSRLHSFCESSTSDKCQALLSSFRANDADGSKQVSGRDFRRIILASELPLTAVEIALLSRLFVGSPGFIDYDRFLKFVTTGVDAGASSFREKVPKYPVHTRSTSSVSVVQQLLDTLPRDQQATALLLAQAIAAGSLPASDADRTRTPASSPHRPTSSAVKASQSPLRSPRKDLGPPVDAVPVKTGGASLDASMRSVGVNVTSSLIDEKLERYKRDGIWSCPACYYTQSKAFRKSCAMCNGDNPYDDSLQTKWKCGACSFLNADVYSHCKMCGLPMTAHVPAADGGAFDTTMSTYRPSAASSPVPDVTEKPAHHRHASSSMMTADVSTHRDSMRPFSAAPSHRPDSSSMQQVLSQSMPRGYGGLSSPYEPPASSWGQTGAGVQASIFQRLAEGPGRHSIGHHPSQSTAAPASFRWSVGGHRTGYSR